MHFKNFLCSAPLYITWPLKKSALLHSFAEAEAVAEVTAL